MTGWNSHRLGKWSRCSISGQSRPSHGVESPIGWLMDLRDPWIDE